MFFKNREEAKLLSDEDFERVGRRKKVIGFITVLIILLLAAILVFKWMNKASDNDINVTVPQVGKVAEEKTEDEKVISEKDMEQKEFEQNLMPEGKRGEIRLDFGRKTEAGDNEFICEFTEIKLPKLLRAGDYADVRLSLADGRNYTVVSEKKIMDYDLSEDKPMVYLALCEEEIIILESALSDLKLFEGSKLYLVVGKQPFRNKINYPVNKNADKLLNSKKVINNLSGYSYEVEFDKELEEERQSRMKLLLKSTEEWKDAATYWNGKG